MIVKLHRRFQQRVRAILQVEGMSQGELARRMKVSPQTVSNYLIDTADAKCPGLDMVEKFAKALGLTDAGPLLQEEEIHQPIG